ncbi:MAG: putative DNA binding domain-containing protein [Lentisphaeria bacterium]|nr:putative DNA binding domain-containing protein [Lentisphaeria bacterium]
MAQKTEEEWRSLVYQAFETDQLDYKAHMDWNRIGRSGRAKLLKHCLALANTRGGYIVVGVGENRDGRPVVYKGLNPRQAKSFDPTNVGNFINHHADPPIDFDVERVELDGKVFAVFVIRRFKDIPHVCSHSVDVGLVQGAFYIRTPEASSRPAHRASEMHRLIQKALRNQREELGRMLRGLLYESGRSGPDDDEDQFADQIKLSREFFEEYRPKKTFTIRLDVSLHNRVFLTKQFGLQEIKDAFVEANVLQMRKIPEHLVEQQGYFTNYSFRIFSANQMSFLHCFQSGLVHFSSYIELDNNEVQFDDILERVSLFISYMADYVNILKFDNPNFVVNCQLEGVKDVRLRFNEQTSSRHYCSRINEIDVTLQRNLHDLGVGKVKHIKRILKAILLRFNIPEDKLKNLDETIKDVLEL